MTTKERETIIRAVGMIEGVSCCVEDGAAEALVSVVETIDKLLEGGQDNG